MSNAHPGFKAVQRKIARTEGVSSDEAGAILASSTRKASPAARRKNPRLARVKTTPAKAAKPKKAPRPTSLIRKAMTSTSSY